ncbi:hypothetical protein V5N11_003893 [Cardamine amara subsp. amara]|uniref:RNase H type-1 domain-containing protein n=1 Tax=Cardamine amara subsp. amara TaxID=228776 RepID=A0ABD0Z3N4_CARAN
MDYVMSNSRDTQVHQETPVTTPIRRWTKPEQGKVKVNVDGSFVIHGRYAGAGWVIRDDQGAYCLSGSSRLTQASSPIQADALALLHAIEAIWCRGYRNVTIEGDCKALFDSINLRSRDIRIENIIVNIHSWADIFSHILFS